MGSSTASARTDVRPALLKRLGENSCLDKQRDKIREIGQALRQAGFVGLDKQAKALGLCRSTTWTILQGDHKTSGLNAKLIHRMLSRDELPTAVRVLLREYVLEKARGDYGHKSIRRRHFAARFKNIPELAALLKTIARVGNLGPESGMS